MAETSYKAVARIVIDGDDRAYRATVNRLKRQAAKDGEIIQRSLFQGAAIGAAAGFFTKQFADFEKGLAGVSKTSGLVSDDLRLLGERIQEMAQAGQAGTQELLAVAQAAAQLGVSGTDNILAYTNAIEKLAAASTLTSEQAAFALARLSAITGLDSDKVDNLASVFSKLGNNLAVTETELVDSSNAIAAAGVSYGITADQALGLAGSFGAIGLAAQSNGTQVAIFFRALGEATREGGERLATFAQVMGVSGEEVKRLFQEDIIEALTLFTEGLGRLGNEADVYLERVGISEARATRLLKASGETMREALDLAHEGFIEGDAHLKEYAVETDNLDGSMRRLINTLEVLSQRIGSELEPSVRSATDATQAFVAANLSPLTTTITTLGRVGLAYVSIRAGAAAARVASANLKLALLGFRGVGRTASDAVGGVWRVVRDLTTDTIFFSRVAAKTFVRSFKNMSSHGYGLGHAIRMAANSFKYSGEIMTTFGRKQHLTMRLMASGMRILRGGVKALGLVWGATWRLMFLFLPEISRFLIKTIPEAIDVLGMKWDWLTNVIQLGFLYLKKVFADYMVFYTQGIDRISNTINRIFGTELPTALSDSWIKTREATEKEVDNILWQQERLEGKMGESWGRIGDNVVGTFGEIVESGKSMLGIVDQLQQARVASPTRGDLYSTSGSDIAGQAANPPGVVGPPAPVTEGEEEVITPSFIGSQFSQQDARGLAQRDRERIRARMEAEEAAAKEALRIEAEKNTALAQMAEEFASHQQDIADQQAAHERMMNEREMDAELEVYRMKLEGEQEYQIQHWETMRELEDELLEAKHARDDAELDRVLRAMELEKAAHKKKEREKTMDTLKQGAAALKGMKKEHTAYAEFIGNIRRAEALYNLAVKGPSLAAEAFGRAQAAFPPPFGQVLGAAAAAAVLAQMAGAVNAVESSKLLPRFQQGGVVPGFGLTDSQMALVQPGEAITPTKNYSDVEDGIRTRLRREMGYGDDGDTREVRVKIEPQEGLDRLIAEQTLQADVMRVA